MRAQAIRVGEQLIDAESKLNRALKDRTGSLESQATLAAAFGRQPRALRAS